MTLASCRSVARSEVVAGAKRARAATAPTGGAAVLVRTDGSLRRTSCALRLVSGSAEAATPFATPVQYAELRLVGAPLLAGVVAILLAVRRPPAAPAPLAPYPAPSKEPEAASGTSFQAPGWKDP